MIMFIHGITNSEKLYLKALEIVLPSGEKTELSWNAIDGTVHVGDNKKNHRRPNSFFYTCKGVKINGEDGNGKLQLLEEMRVIGVKRKTTESHDTLDWIGKTPDRVILLSIEIFDESAEENCRLFISPVFYSDNTFPLEAKDVAIDSEIQFINDPEEFIEAYIETWFSVDDKFGLNTDAEEDASLNMYLWYNPEIDVLRVICTISYDCEEQTWFEYQPSEHETEMFKDLLAEKINELFHQTPEEFFVECRKESQI